VAEITAGGAAWKLDGIDIPRPEVCLTGHHDLTGFFFVGLGIGGAAEIHLLGAEQDDTDRAAGSLRQAGDQSGGGEGDGDTGAVIGSPGAEIPGIEMSTDENDLIRTLSTLDLADDVPGRRILLKPKVAAEAGSVPDPAPPTVRAARRRNGQRRRRNLRRAVLVFEGPGMGQTMAIGAKRAQQIGDGARFAASEGP